MSFLCASLAFGKLHPRIEGSLTYVRNWRGGSPLASIVLWPRGRALHPDKEAVVGSLIRRLRESTALDDADAEAIGSLPVMVKQFRPDQPIVTKGDRPLECCLLVEGFCVRAKTTSDGRRQILSIHIPGEIPDLQSLHLHVMDHDLITLTNCSLGFIGHPALKELTRSRPSVTEALWRDTLVDAAIFREWIVNVGQRAGV